VLDSIEATIYGCGRFADQLKTLNDHPWRLSRTLFCCPSQLVNEGWIVMDYSDFVAAAQPEEIQKALTANAEQIASAGHAHGSGDLSSMRYASHKGHQITVRTTYEITVDDRPFASRRASQSFKTCPSGYWEPLSPWSTSSASRTRPAMCTPLSWGAQRTWDHPRKHAAPSVMMPPSPRH
jgi:hypothetical protein